MGQAFCEAASKAGPRTRTCRVLGFTGWRACVAQHIPQYCEVFRGDQDVDAVLLDAVRSEVSEPVFQHIQQETTRLLSSNDACEEEEEEPTDDASCDQMVVGP